MIATTASSSTSCLQVPLPKELLQLAKRLQSLSQTAVIPDEDIISILFVVRLAHAMHGAAYATFLTSSFVKDLCLSLEINELDLHLRVFGTQWIYNHGVVVAQYRIPVDLDGRTMYQTSRIALGVMHGSLSPLQGLELIHQCEMTFSNTHEKERDDVDNNKKVPSLQRFESLYRTFPLRMFVLPLLSCTAAGCIFDGTGVDVGIAFLTGLVAGLIHYACHLHSSLAPIQDFMVTFSASLISLGAFRLWPQHVCPPTIILATMFWFYYGIAFVLSLYEITTSHLLVTGLSRFGMSILNTYVLAFGSSLGIWVMGFGTNEGIDEDVLACTDLQSHFADAWLILLYPVLGVCALMHLRVSPKHWILCLIVQFVGQATQFLFEDVWNAPVFLSSLGSSFMSTMAAHAAISVANLHNCVSLVTMLDRPVKSVECLRKRLDDVLITNTIAATTCRSSQNLETNATTTSPSDEENRLVATTMRISIEDGCNHYGGNDDSTTTRSNNTEPFQYQRADLWFCLLPALYLLVPGSKVYRLAFLSIVDSVQTYTYEETDVDDNELAEEFYITAVIVLGMGLVLGIKIAFVTLWLLSKCIGQSRCLGFGRRKRPPVQQQEELSIPIPNNQRTWSSPTSTSSGGDVLGSLSWNNASDLESPRKGET